MGIVMVQLLPLLLEQTHPILFYGAMQQQQIQLQVYVLLVIYKVYQTIILLQ